VIGAENVAIFHFTPDEKDCFIVTLVLHKAVTAPRFET